MNKPTDMGTNRTGIAAAPVQGPKAVEGAREGTVAETTSADDTDLARVRETWSAESAPIGSVPPPLTVKGMAGSALAALTGEKASVFVDKLGERLAFERTGTRLYEAVLAKARAAGPTDRLDPTPVQLAEICEEEQRHFDLLRSSIDELGADPTAQTPSADVAGVAGMGLVQVVSDPRTTLTEALEALLVAELTDNEGWSMLIELARGLGYHELSTRFVDAQRAEATHLRRVRTWLSRRMFEEAGARPSA